MTEQAQAFAPDWVSPPGETVEDLLEERSWSQAELAERTGLTRKHINDLVKGRVPITGDTASRLDKVLGGSAQFWLTREAQYRAVLEGRRDLEALRGQADWLGELPLAWAIKQGWLHRVSDQGEQVQECLRYFGVATVAAWRETYTAPLAAFRASADARKSLGAVAIWLREVEREAERLPCRPFDRQAFKAALPRLRALTTETDPRVFVPEVQKICADCGVAVVLVPAPPGCPVHGATRWLGSDRALLALTLRYKTNDQLWFSLFHEAAHILKHGKKLLVIEGIDGLDADLEREADRFAADLLVAPKDALSLKTLRSAAEVEQAAQWLGVAPGILVGRMQKEGWIPWSNLNALKVRYEWVQPGAEHG